MGAARGGVALTFENRVPAGRRPQRRAARLSRHITRFWQLYLMVLPALVYLLLFHYWPIYGIQLAFRRFNPVMGITGSPWVGLANLKRFFQSFQAKSLIWNTVYLSLLGTVFSFPIPILLSLLLNQMRSLRYKRLIQTVTYAPHFISTVVLVGMLQVFLSPNTGIAGHLMRAANLQPYALMGSTAHFRAIYVLSGIWQSSGWGMILYLATLSNVDPELYEAAMIDGADKPRQILHIDLPVLVPTITIMLILNLGGIMSSSFEKVFLMQNSLNIGVSEVISTYVYKIGLQNADYSYSTAIGLFNSVVNFFMLVLANTLANRINGSGLW